MSTAGSVSRHSPDGPHAAAMSAYIRPTITRAVSLPARGFGSGPRAPALRPVSGRPARPPPLRPGAAPPGPPPPRHAPKGRPRRQRERQEAALVVADGEPPFDERL